MKLLHWEHGGFVLYYKRLEGGTFPLPKTSSPGGEIDWSELVLMVEGIVVEESRRRHRFSLKKWSEVIRNIVFHLRNQLVVCIFMPCKRHWENFQKKTF